MLTAPTNRKSSSAKTEHLYKSVHSKPPTTAVSMTLFGTLEKQLVKKSLLKPPAHGSPLWFVAETERNVFLWRHGMSLSDQDLFEVWIDVPGIIQKRLRQLKNNSSVHNPFTPSMWDKQTSEESCAEEEEYLLAFEALVKPILDHAHALSHIESALCQEYLEGEEKLRVVLPQPTLGGVLMHKAKVIT